LTLDILSSIIKLQIFIQRSKFMTDNEILKKLEAAKPILQRKSDCFIKKPTAERKVEEIKKKILYNYSSEESYISSKLGDDAAFAYKELNEVEKPALRNVFLGGTILAAVLWIVFSFIAPVPFLSTVCIFAAIVCGFLYWKKDKEIKDYSRWLECKEKYGKDIPKVVADYNREKGALEAEIQALTEQIEELKKTPEIAEKELEALGLGEILHKSWWLSFYVNKLCDYLHAGLTWEESFNKVKEEAEIESQIRRQCDSCAYRFDCKKDKVLNCASYIPKS